MIYADRIMIIICTNEILANPDNHDNLRSILLQMQTLRCILPSPKTIKQMPNSYFRFKQFTVRQDQCAMKVCTDACLFGAWIAASSQLIVHNLLDVGAGTGLLSLMYAQKKPFAMIDAVEIDAAAAKQAKENFGDSPWKERLQLHHCPIQEFNPPVKYDLIFSNPPFFDNDLKSDDHKRNLALHSSALSFDDLIESAAALLRDDGLFAVLLPYHRAVVFIKAAKEKDLFLQQQINVKQSVKHNYFRVILLFGKQQITPSSDEIIIADGQGQYTATFAGLLKDYYLKL